MRIPKPVPQIRKPPTGEPRNMRQLYDAAHQAEGYNCAKCVSYARDREEGSTVTIVWPGDHRTHVHAHDELDALYRITLKPYQPGGSLPPGRGVKNGGT